jgi:hypothetical protein
MTTCPSCSRAMQISTKNSGNVNVCDGKDVVNGTIVVSIHIIK